MDSSSSSAPSSDIYAWPGIWPPLIGILVLLGVLLACAGIVPIKKAIAYAFARPDIPQPSLWTRLKQRVFPTKVAPETADAAV